MNKLAERKHQKELKRKEKRKKLDSQERVAKVYERKFNKLKYLQQQVTLLLNEFKAKEEAKEEDVKSD